MRYNIPGVFTSVIDRSYIQPLLVEGRSVFIAGFSKFGEDKFYEFGDAETMEFTLGALDIEKYGLGLMYGVGALTKTRNVIFKRLMPTDSTYANLIFMSDGTTRTRPETIDDRVIMAELDLDPGFNEKTMFADELEITAFAGQDTIVWEYNPENLSVFLAGGELRMSEYVAMDGKTILFKTPLIEDRIVNLYTVGDARNPAEVIPGDNIIFINEEYNATGNVTDIEVTGGYVNEDGIATNIWCTVNGLDLANADYTAVNGKGITLHLGGIAGNGLIDDDFMRIHGVIDNTEDHQQTDIYEDIIGVNNQNVIHYPSGYNPNITAVSVNGLMLGNDDYKAEDGEYIYLAQSLVTSDVVRLHTIQPGEDINMWGSIIAKAQGDGYNDLHVQFRPAYDVERHYTDYEGDTKYKFNFLKAVVFEETPVGKRVVSEEFAVSLLDKDPVSGMPIVGSITGENLYIDTKFGDSNEYLNYYSNYDLMSELYKELNIDELTRNGISGVDGENRIILKNQITAVTYERKNLNIELFVGTSFGIEFRAVPIEGKEKIFAYYTDPITGVTTVHAISMIDGVIHITQEGTTGTILDTMYIDGNDSFYEIFILDENGGGGVQDLVLAKRRYTNTRQQLYNILTTDAIDATWQLASGSNGWHLIKDGRLNMGEAVNRYGQLDGGIYRQNAKQLMLYFYETDETIHEVLYPELDFDYVPDWTADMDVQAAIIMMADEIGFTMPIVSLPRTTSPEKDFKQRTEGLYMSSFNSAIYSGQNNDNHYLSLNGKIISCPNSYYAMQVHLQTDNNISITEPAANVVKGQMPVAGMKLSYIAKSKDIEKLRMVQINTIIKETDGIYFIDQLTSYKAASKLTRINVVKPIHRMRKDLPRLLKDLLQRKATTNVINDAKFRTERYMTRWQIREDNLVHGIFDDIVVTPVFIQEELKLVISISITPIGTIEKIEIPITVY